MPGLLSGPLVVVANHPSWWDPLVGLILTEFMHEGRVHYCPIDVNGLTQYPFLERLGFFGVEVGTPRGSLAFLRQSQSILSSRRVGSLDHASGWIRRSPRTTRHSQARDRAPGLSTVRGHDLAHGPRVSVLERPLPRSPGEVW